MKSLIIMSLNIFVKVRLSAELTGSGQWFGVPVSNLAVSKYYFLKLIILIS